MSCDKLVYDLSQEVEGSPNVFIRKDWINILDNQNQNYQNNQSIIDTSQLANSNKYMSYREAYLAVPMLLSYRTPVQATTAVQTPNDFSIGLKNWFGSIIHSMTLDYNGTTIVQQTPFCNMWNSFKLLTTLSWGDISTMGPTIGFYPDTSDAWIYTTTAANTTSGVGICNSTNGGAVYAVGGGPLSINKYNQADGVVGNPTIGGNTGLTYRTKWIAYNPDANAGTVSYGAGFVSSAFSAQLWKSNISRKVASGAAGQTGILQISVMATIYLKHLHSFFNMCPLLKGVFMKLTFNLNNSTCTVANSAARAALLGCTNSTSFVGGIQPILVPSSTTGGYLSNIPTASNAFYDLVVGSRCYNNDILNPPAGSPAAAEGNVSKSVYLYVPAYTFNPTFEQAYLSNNVKQIKYTDIYQYQFDFDSGQSGFNQLITNGIANIKSVLIIPYYRLPMATGGANVVQFQSPFDPAGAGPCAPMASITNFNIQISGQNAIYNMQRYTFEEWNNQLYGQNAVNGGLTDGLTSGLLDFNDFQHSYSYYYVNVERMLPVEQSVPKSVQVIGQNLGTLPIRAYVFIEYGVSVAIDVLTGARV
jgi:hypothetical protein